MSKKIVVEYDFPDGFEDTGDNNVCPGIIYEDGVEGSDGPGVMMPRELYERMHERDTSLSAEVVALKIALHIERIKTRHVESVMSAARYYYEKVHNIGVDRCNCPICDAFRALDKYDSGSSGRGGE